MGWGPVRVGAAIRAGVGRRCVRALLASLGHFELISLPLGGCLLKQIDKPIHCGLLLIGSVAEVIVEGDVGCFPTVGIARGLECI